MDDMLRYVVPVCDVIFVQGPALVGAFLEPPIQQGFHLVAIGHFTDFRMSDHRLVRHLKAPFVCFY